MSKTNEQMAMRASKITIVSNIGLTAFKLFAGIVGNSTAMIADAMHSFSDMYTTIIVMIGVKLANKQSDKDHQYGHERFECVAAILLSAVLVFTGALIGWAGIQQLIAWDFDEASIPRRIALVGAIATIILQGIMYVYKRGVARKINSSALKADAWHHLSDSLSSIGSFFGILGARMGFPMLDPIAAILICLFILKVAFDVFRDATGKMTDKACDDNVIEEIRTTALAEDGVLGVDEIKTRLFGDKFYLDIEISADGKQSLNDAHEIAERVHYSIEAQFENLKHCMVHVNPYVQPCGTTHSNETPHNL